MQSATLHPPRPTVWNRLQSISERTVLAWLTLIGLLTRTGAYWDVQWHSVVGRDRFWIPPHDLIYAGVGFAGLAGLMMVLLDARRNGWRPQTWAWLLVMGGAGVMVCAAPFDDLWHRRFGIDITIWSPPHMVGVLGGWLIDWGLVLGWSRHLRQADSAQERRRTLVGLLVAATLVFSIGNFGLVPAVRWSVTQPIAPTIYALYGSVLLSLIAVVATRLSGRWWFPLAMLAGLGVLRLLDLAVHAWSVETVVPWTGMRLRGSPDGIENHFTTHLLLNAAPLALVAVAAAVIRERWNLFTTMLAGAAGGLGIMLGILVLRTGKIVPIFRSGLGSHDFVVEAQPFIRTFGQSDGRAWAYAIVGGLLAGVIAHGLLRWRERPLSLFGKPRSTAAAS